MSGRDYHEEYDLTAADMAPFLKMHPQGLTFVLVHSQLIPIRDVHYDNERGIHIIELDQRALTIATRRT